MDIVIGKGTKLSEAAWENFIETQVSDLGTSAADQKMHPHDEQIAITITTNLSIGTVIDKLETRFFLTSYVLFSTNKLLIELVEEHGGLRSPSPNCITISGATECGAYAKLPGASFEGIADSSGYNVYTTASNGQCYDILHEAFGKIYGYGSTGTARIWAWIRLFECVQIRGEEDINYLKTLHGLADVHFMKDKITGALRSTCRIGKLIDALEPYYTVTVIIGDSYRVMKLDKRPYPLWTLPRPKLFGIGVIPTANKRLQQLALERIPKNSPTAGECFRAFEDAAYFNIHHYSRVDNSKKIIITISATEWSPLGPGAGGRRKRRGKSRGRRGKIGKSQSRSKTRSRSRSKSARRR